MLRRLVYKLMLLVACWIGLSAGVQAVGQPVAATAGVSAGMEVHDTHAMALPHTMVQHDASAAAMMDCCDEEMPMHHDGVCCEGDLCLQLCGSIHCSPVSAMPSGMRAPLLAQSEAARFQYRVSHRPYIPDLSTPPPRR